MSEDVIVLGQETFELGTSIKPITDFFSYYDSGLMIHNGTGVIVHRYGYGSEQIVYQMEPQIKGVTYKQSEGSESSRTYSLAFPYVILAISYEKGIFRGVRHYYSPTPIYSLDQSLYLPNLPNTNCKGYSDTSVGWVCIYHHLHDKFTTLTQKLDYALARYDPMGEPYNYANMPETDGYNFYKDVGRPQWNWMPSRWAKRTEDKGLDWVLDPDSWILLLTDKEGTMYVDGGEPLTLRQALYEKHYVYYREFGAVQLNKYASLPTDEERNKFNKNLIRTALVAGMGKVSVKKTINDILSGIVLPAKAKLAILKLGIVKQCGRCHESVNLDHNLAPNVLTSINGLLSTATRHDVGLSWYCPSCISTAKLIPSNLTKKIYTRLDSDGETMVVDAEEAALYPHHSWKSVGSYETHIDSGYPEYRIIPVISSATIDSVNRDLISNTAGKQLSKRCVACETIWLTTDSLMKVYEADVAENFKNYVLKEVGCRYCLKESYINPYFGRFVRWSEGLTLEIKGTDPISEDWPLLDPMRNYFTLHYGGFKEPMYNAKFTTIMSFSFAQHILYTLLGEKVDFSKTKNMTSHAYHSIFQGIAFTDPESIPRDIIEDRLAVLDMIKKVDNIDH